MQGIGYKELTPVITQGQPVEQALWDVIIHTRHYAKRQNTWLRAEPETRWLTPDGNLLAQAMEQINAFWKGQDKS